MTHKTPLSPSQLYRVCDSSKFSFKTTSDLGDLDGMLGQSRAMGALNFGVGIRQHGYNFYVLGPNGSGKHTFVERFLRQQAKTAPPPQDCCYVNNFSQPHKPRVLQFPKGSAVVFRYDMQQLIDDLRQAIPSAFETEEYHAHLNELEDEFKARVEAAFADLHKAAEEHDIALLRTPHGFTFAPVKGGNVLNPKEYRALSEKEQAKYDETISVLEEQLASIIRQQNQWQRDTREKVKELNRQVALFASGHFIDELKHKYTEYPNVIQHLDVVQEDVIQNLGDFRGEEETTNILGLTETRSFRRYEVNVLVDHSETEGAPVVYEDNPLYQNLVGRIEHKAQMGTLSTDFTLIKPGTLHLANGGYLIIDALKLLQQPFAWEGLKRAIAARQLHIQSLAEMYSIVSTVSLEPEPIPLDVKIVLIGERLLYYLLHEYDPEFPELFKVSADFDNQIDFNEESTQLFAQFIATIVRQDKLRPFEREAVARIIEHSARLIEDSQKLSTHTRSIADLLSEADYWASTQQHDIVTRNDVQQAIDHQVQRSDRVQQHLYEEIKRGTILIDTQGEKVAQINGLSVLELGHFAFGQPSRITATARLGEGEVIDIEREVELGGAIHSKGVYIISAFLGARYAKDRPLSLSASLVFEQSYGGIEGDSASMAELCVLLSALANVPIKQSLAITGSVNQLGESQAIGGVNEKIEGFFDVCKETGFTGDQGVLIPQSNVQHLMLRHDVVEAAEKGEFHIYAYSNVDQAIELLTGLVAGERDESGNYAEETFNYLVEARLIELEDVREKVSRASKEAGEKESDSQDDEKDEQQE